jgi:hypothetical protein
MALIFMDGFDHYNVIGDFWDFAGNDCSIRLNTGQSRTGIGCLQINSAAFGPRRSFPAHTTHVLCCTAWNSSGYGEVMRFQATDLPGFDTQVRVTVNADGSISFNYGTTGALIAQTVGGLVTFGTYVSIAVEIQNFTLNTGIIKCWVNGILVLNQGGLHTQGISGCQYCNGIQLMAPGAIPTTFHDDVYVLDCSTAPNATFIGALKLYAIAPTANAAVAWTPLAGTNWSEVNEIPPDGDTSYNSSPNIGDVDQYVYPLTGVPANSAILCTQHDLDMEVDSGSRSVASDFNGVVNAAATALSSGYHIYPTPYDVNPSTGVAFVPADFPIQAGPKVTA